MCSPTCCSAMSLIINFVPGIYSFCLCDKHIFHWDPGKIIFQPLLIWWLGLQVFIQGTQVQFLGKKLRFDFMPPNAAALLRSVSAKFIHRKMF